jgi:DNA polymerase-3 subunit alpha
MSDKAITGIIKHRPYHDLGEAVQKIGKSCTIKHWECLIKAGALDSLYAGRDKACAYVSALLSTQKNIKVTRDLPCLFSQEEMNMVAADWEQQLQYEPWLQNEVLAYEKALLGFYLSGHPTDPYTEVFKKYTVGSIGKLFSLCAEGQIENGYKVRMGGMIGSHEHKISQKGNAWALIKLEDSTGELNCPLFYNAYTDYKHLLVNHRMVIITGRITMDQTDETKPKIIVDKVEHIEAYQ